MVEFILNMSPSQWLMLVVALIYIGVAINHFIEGRTPLGFVFVGYIVANVAFIFAE